MVACAFLLPGSARAKDGKGSGPESDRNRAGSEVRPRSFRTFLPKPGDAIDDPASQVVQVLLDRQDKGEFDSYMVQILFRGKPSDRYVKLFPDRIEIDFYDTGKPSMRLSKIRGGVVEASSVDEFYYREKQSGVGLPRIKRLVRLTLFMHAKAELKFRDTLDRTLIHFLIPKPAATGK